MLNQMRSPSPTPAVGGVGINEREIPRELQRLEAELARLGSLVEGLGERLRVVTAPNPCNACSADEPAAVTELGLAIQQFRNRATCIADDCEHLLVNCTL